MAGSKRCRTVNEGLTENHWALASVENLAIGFTQTGK